MSAASASTLKSSCSTEVPSSASVMPLVRLPGAGAGVGVGVGVGSGWYGLGEFGGDGAAAPHGEIPEGFGGALPWALILAE